MEQTIRLARAATARQRRSTATATIESEQIEHKTMRTIANDSPHGNSQGLAGLSQEQVMQLLAAQQQAHKAGGGANAPLSLDELAALSGAGVGSSVGASSAGGGASLAAADEALLQQISVRRRKTKKKKKKKKLSDFSFILSNFFTLLILFFLRFLCNKRKCSSSRASGTRALPTVRSPRVDWSTTARRPDAPDRRQHAARRDARHGAVLPRAPLCRGGPRRGGARRDARVCWPVLKRNKRSEIVAMVSDRATSC
jgi:hypothetical protein